MRRYLALLFTWVLFNIYLFQLPVQAAGDFDVTVNTTSINTMVYEEFIVSVTVINVSGSPKTSIRVSGDDGNNTGLEEKQIDSLGDGAQETVYLKGMVSNPGTYIFRITLNGANVGNVVYVRAEEEAESSEEPRLSITDVTFIPATPVVSNEFQVRIHIRNEGNSEARNVTAYFEGGSNFETLDLTGRTNVGSIQSGTRGTATFRIRAKSSRESNLVTVRLTYQHSSGESTVSETLNLPLGGVDASSGKQPYLKLGTFNVEPQNDQGDFILRFHVRNIGQGAAKQIAVGLDSSQAFPRESSNMLYVQQLSAGTSTELSLKMRVADTDSTAYKIPMTISCVSDDGKEFSIQETITFSAETLGLKKAQADATVPRVMLGKYTLSQDQILAGNRVTLTLHIDNNSIKEVRNIKISLGVIQISGETGGTVLSPVNSSNSFYIEKIPGKNTHVRAIELYVDPNAAAKTYIVPVDILYEDSDGNQYQVDELVNIPVTQESRLQVLSVEVPPMGGIGQPVPVSAEFVNVGKVALKNLLVSIEGDFPKENASYFLANFEIGMSDYFQGMIIPQAEGLVTGMVVFTYTDNMNKEVRLEKPFELTVQQMDWEKPPDFPPDFSRDEGTSFFGRVKSQLIWLLPTIIIAAGGVFIVLKKMRAKRRELFDEEL